MIMVSVKQVFIKKKYHLMIVLNVNICQLYWLILFFKTDKSYYRQPFLEECKDVVK